MMHTFLGYGDNDLVHQQLKINSLMCTCRSVTFTDKATIVGDKKGMEEIEPAKGKMLKSLKKHLAK